MTKSEEREFVDKTIARLPDSYLKDILVSEREPILRAIDEDLCYIDITALQVQVVEEQANVKLAQRAVNAAKHELAQIQVQHDRFESSIRELRTTARQLASV